MEARLISDILKQMASLFIKIIPLLIGSMISPGIFALVLYFLSEKQNGVKKTFAFLTGTLILATGVFVLAYYLSGEHGNDHVGNLKVKEYLDLIFGVVFVYFGIKSLFVKSGEKKVHLKHQVGVNYLLLIGAGILLNLTNFDNELMYFGGLREIFNSALPPASEFALGIFALLVFISPVTLPLGFALLAPKTAEKVLTPVNAFVTKYSRYIIAILFLVFGIFLLSRGL